MHYELTIEHLIGNTWQVVDYYTSKVYFQGSYQDCSRYKNSE